MKIIKTKINILTNWLHRMELKLIITINRKIVNSKCKCIYKICKIWAIPNYLNPRLLFPLGKICINSRSTIDKVNQIILSQLLLNTISSPSKIQIKILKSIKIMNIFCQIKKALIIKTKINMIVSTQINTIYKKMDNFIQLAIWSKLKTHLIVDIKIKPITTMLTNLYNKLKITLTMETECWLKAINNQNKWIVISRITK